MNLILNGAPTTAPAPLSVRGLLEHLGLSKKPVVVELNQCALFPREFEGAMLNDGDRIEIVQITAGG